MRNNNRFTLIPLILILALLAGVGMSARPGLAQAVNPTPTATPDMPEPTVDPSVVQVNSNDPNTLVFSQLGAQESTMRGPYDTYRVRFGLPASWKIDNYAEVRLVLDPFFSSTRPGLTGENVAPVGAVLDVSMNGQKIKEIVLNWTGPREIVIPLPLGATTSRRQDGRQDLELFLDAGVDCDFDYITTVVVRTDSSFYLPHTLVPLTPSLAKLPAPIYQEGLTIPSTALIVIPNQPDAEEMQAALTVAAGFGRMSQGDQLVQLVKEADVESLNAAEMDLIYVGKAASFSGLAQMALPAKWNGSVFALGSIQSGDGVLQMIPSPWNNSRALLLVSGDTGAAAVKAAQALSSQSIITVGRPDLAVIKEVQPVQPLSAVAIDRTFAELGYGPLEMSGAGLASTEVRFSVPAGQVTDNDAYVNLVFNYSAAIDFDRSSMSVLLNDMPIGGVLFSGETVTTTEARITIPKYALRPGINSLLIEVELIPPDYCTDINFSNLWATVSPESLLHIPLTPAVTTVTPLQDLSTYPFTFADSPTLETLAFVVPQDDTAAWNQAAKVAVDLGGRAEGGMVELVAAFAGAVPEEMRQQRDLVIVGKATGLPLLQEMNDSLPVGFEPNSNVAVEKGPRVVYRLPEGASLGYLQLLPSPWNASRTVLAVLGTNDEGLAWAGGTITTPSVRGRLAGNFAVVNDLQVLTSDTRMNAVPQNISATVVPGGTVEAQPLPQSTPVPPSGIAGISANKNWILPFVAGSSVLALLILIFGVVTSLRKKK